MHSDTGDLWQVKTAMERDEESPDRILVRLEGPSAYVRIEGRGTFRNSLAFKDFGLAAADRGARRLVLDCSACTGMDSTFMGVIAGLAFRYRKLEGGQVCAVHLSTKLHHLLSNLGLNRVIDLRREDQSEATESEVQPGSLQAADTRPRGREELTRTMIEAHEDLIKTSAANLPKFRDVLVFLREDLQRHVSESDGT